MLHFPVTGTIIFIPGLYFSCILPAFPMPPTLTLLSDPLLFLVPHALCCYFQEVLNVAQEVFKGREGRVVRRGRYLGSTSHAEARQPTQAWGWTT